MIGAETLLRQDNLFIPGKSGSPLIVACTSYGGHGAPPLPNAFEWRYVLQPFDCNALLLIDVFQHWYHGPILNFTAGLDDTVRKIENLRLECDAPRLIMVGSSMGGHGALLLGAMTAADFVLAFAPQVQMSAMALDAMGDSRWATKAAELNAIGYDHLDLADTFAVQAPQHTAIFYDDAQRLDAIHAATLDGIAGVEVVARVDGGHEISYAMTKSGETTAILLDAINGIRRPHTAG